MGPVFTDVAPGWGWMVRGVERLLSGFWGFRAVGKGLGMCHWRLGPREQSCVAGSPDTQLFYDGLFTVQPVNEYGQKEATTELFANLTSSPEVELFCGMVRMLQVQSLLIIWGWSL